ncbi:hypothetical protein ESZ50_05735 [Weissella muntiaci]|uniref:Uncharacterized protein n=1 Tax=Weissella muntiaci TaxID=2508881 RepID=A0A6C2C711_9LACO|nr:hypothetical protein [Weissella muntiaci]TYC49644.1 hypothetical protein ESZ50_05735 [Weissella muntiaci]
MKIVIGVILLSLFLLYKNKTDKEIQTWKDAASHNHDGYSKAVAISKETFQLLEDKKIPYLAMLESLDVEIDEDGNVDPDSLIVVAQRLGHNPNRPFNSDSYWYKKLLEMYFTQGG